MNSLKITEVLENFPFRAIRDRQRKVIEDICNALNSGCKHIILEAPTGIGKSAVGISLAWEPVTFILLQRIYSLNTQEISLF
jgi:superfamily II DNA or RNA helicase